MSECDRRPSAILATHERLRCDGFPVTSIMCGRRASDGRVFLSTWLNERGRRLVIAPDPSLEAGCNAYRFCAGEESLRTDGSCCHQIAHLPTLLFVGDLSLALPAATDFAVLHPTIPVSVATTTDALLDTLLDSETPSRQVSAALQGLVPVEAVEDRILTTVVNARQLAPLLRSPYEGLVYYMLESRGETQGCFETNQRLDKPGGRGSYEVDLLCRAAKLVIEIDGGQHDSPAQRARDEVKQKDLEGLGYRVRRFSTEQVATEPVGVWRLIHEQLASVAADRQG